MHDALACQPDESSRREHHELAQLAKGDGHDQEGKSADRHGQCHPLQHAARHHPPAHRHIVERKSERAESGVKDTEQATYPAKTYILLVCLQCRRHSVMAISISGPFASSPLSAIAATPLGMVKLFI